MTSLNKFKETLSFVDHKNRDVLVLILRRILASQDIVIRQIIIKGPPHEISSKVMYPLDNHDLFIQSNENCEFLKATVSVLSEKKRPST